jgi:hypothetical protein
VDGRAESEPYYYITTARSNGMLLALQGGPFRRACGAESFWAGKVSDSRTSHPTITITTASA